MKSTRPVPTKEMPVCDWTIPQFDRSLSRQRIRFAVLLLFAPFVTEQLEKRECLHNFTLVNTPPRSFFLHVGLAY
jgi:hypothetical protein